MAKPQWFDTTMSKDYYPSVIGEYDLDTVREALAGKWARSATQSSYAPNPFVSKRDSDIAVAFNKLYRNWLKGSKGRANTPWNSFKTNYLRWLRQGGKLWQHDPERKEVGDPGYLNTAYLTDEGWRGADELTESNPIAQYIKMRREAAFMDEDLTDPYWEHWQRTVPAQWRVVDSVLPAKATTTSSLPYTGMNLSRPEPRPNPPAPPRPSTAKRKTININFNNDYGTGNRVGNRASTAAAGQVARTPAGVYYSTKQARERAAKRAGRRISQSGVTSTPSLIRMARYKMGYM